MLEHAGKGKQPPTENKSASRQCGAVTPKAKGQGHHRNPGKKVGQAQLDATGLQVATTTLTQNNRRFKWKRAKRNLETKYGLHIGILNIGTLREKEEVTLLVDERKLTIFGLSEIRETISGRRIIHNNYTCLSSGHVGGKHGVAFIIAP